MEVEPVPTGRSDPGQEDGDGRRLLTEVGRGRGCSYYYAMARLDVSAQLKAMEIQ